VLAAWFLVVFFSLHIFLQFNVGTSGAEIGAAFGGNKVRRLVVPFQDIKIANRGFWFDRALGGKFGLSDMSKLILTRLCAKGPGVWRRRMEAVCAMECLYQ
jgi:hypothetical protein